MKVKITVEAELDEQEVKIFKGKTDQNIQGQADLVKDILRDPTGFAQLAGTKINWTLKK